jgi:biotin carboxylase
MIQQHLQKCAASAGTGLELWYIEQEPEHLKQGDKNAAAAAAAAAGLPCIPPRRCETAEMKLKLKSNVVWYGVQWCAVLCCAHACISPPELA